MPDVTVKGVVNPMRFPEEMPTNDIRTVLQGKFPGPSNSRNDTGSTRNSNRASPTGKFADVVREVDQLTPGESANLGIPK